MQLTSDLVQRRSDSKLDRIVSQSAVLFAEKGYHSASMRDIAAATGLSLAGLYHYFGSKDELLYVIQARVLTALLERIRLNLDGVEDASRRIEILVETHLVFFLQHMPEMTVLAHEGRSLVGKWQVAIDRKKRVLTEMVMEMLGALRPDAGERPELEVATLTLFGMLNWTYTWYDAEQAPPPRDLAHQMSAIFLDGYVHREARAAGGRVN